MEQIFSVIVDDEKPARQRLLDLLAKQSDIAVAGEATNGIEAIQLIRECKPDLLFLDIQMPILGGFDVINQIGAANLPLPFLLPRLILMRFEPSKPTHSTIC